MNAKDEFAIDTRPFVLTGFYQMVDPNGSKLFGYNAHKLVHAVMLAFTSSCTFVGLSGVFYRPEDAAAAAATAVDSAKYDVQTLFYAACVAVGNLKMITAIRDAETVWRLFFVARGEEPSAAAVAFGGRPRNDGVQLASRGKRLANVFAWYSFLFASTVLAWVTMPIILNRGGSASGSGTQPDDENFRKTNVVNLRYPGIAAKTYNKFYGIFFAMESVMASYTAFILVVFDLFLIAQLRFASVQYEIVSSAYERLKCKFENENDGESNTRKFRNEFIAITLECQHIYERLKVTYKISRPIVLVYMLEDAIGMVSLPYLIAMCYEKNGSSVFTSEVLTFLWTLCVVGIQSYVYCSLFQRVNERKEAINFGLYSCDWTSLSVRQKKLILLAMQMNNANRLKMNATPTKHIDLPMLANIVRSSYRITSVMINSDNHK